MATTAPQPAYGIQYIILTSLFATCLSVMIAVPIELLTAVFLTEMANKMVAAVVANAVELLAAVQSVIYGLLGMLLLNPCLYKLEKICFAGDKEHKFTGGANLLAAVIALAIMILPTVISVSSSSLRSVALNLRAASLVWGQQGNRKYF